MYDLGNQFHIDLEKLKCNNNSIIQGAKYRISILTERLIRLEYNKNGLFNDLATELVIFRNFDKPLFEVKEREGGILEINTKYFKLEYIKEMPFYNKGINPSKNLKVSTTGTDNYWYYGHPEVKNYFGSNNVLSKNANDKVNRGLYSLDGFVSFDDSNTLRINELGTIVSPNPDSIDIYLFVYGKDFGLAISDYFKLTGMPSFIPRYALGNWWCRDQAYSTENVDELLDKFNQIEVPIAVLLLDKDWHKRGTVNKSLTVSGYSFNQDLFPNPKEFIDGLHNKGIRLGLSIDPSEGIYPFENYYSEVQKYLSTNANAIIKFDPLNPRFLDVYFKVLIHPLEVLGVDFFWNDFSNLKNLTTLWVLNHYHSLDMTRNNNRGMILSRNALIAAHRYPVLTSGNLNISWDNFKLIPFFNLSASNIGVCWWSHDICGYSGGIEERELYIRSVQLGVFSPILRFHSSGGKYYKREPWLWNKETYEIVNDFLKLRHKLIPYLYTEAYKYSTTGTMVFQPLYYIIPKVYDDVIYRNEYFFGSGLLVAPITTKKDMIMNRTIHRFYLPEGIWYDFFTGKKFIGNKKYIGFYKDEDYPVFARKGSIIPMSLKSNYNNTANPTDLEIQIFPGNSNTYELYEDDGISLRYKDKIWFKTIIEYVYEPDNYTLTIKIDSNNKRDIVPEYRNYVIRFRNTKDVEKVTCTIDNSNVEFNSYEDGTDYVIEVNNIYTFKNLNITCSGTGIEIDAVRLVNEDIDNILSDLQIQTELKEKISDAIFGHEKLKDKRIALRKLKRQGLDKSFVKLFLNLLEYTDQI